MNNRQGLGSMGKHNSHRKVGNLFESDDLNRISCVFFLARNPFGLVRAV